MADGSNSNAEDSDTGHNPSGSMIIKEIDLSRERKFTEIDLIPFRPEFQSLLIRGGDEDEDENDGGDGNNNDGTNMKTRSSVTSHRLSGILGPSENLNETKMKEKRETWCQYDESDLAIEPETEWPMVYKSSNNGLWRSCFGTIIIDHRTMYNNNDLMIDNPRFGINFDSKYPSRTHSQQPSQELGQIHSNSKYNVNRLSIADASKLISNIGNAIASEYIEPKQIPSFMIEFGKCIEWEIEITDMKDGDDNGKKDCVLLGICEYNDQINERRKDFLSDLKHLRLTQRQSVKHIQNRNRSNNNNDDYENNSNGTNESSNFSQNDKFIEQIDGICYALTNTGKILRKTFADISDNSSQDTETQFDSKLEMKVVNQNVKLKFSSPCNVRLRLDYSDMAHWKLQGTIYQGSNKALTSEDYVTLFDDIPPGSYRLAASLLCYESTIKLHNCDVLGAYKLLHNAYGSFFTDFENTNFGMHIVSNMDPENNEIVNESDNGATDENMKNDANLEYETDDSGKIVFNDDNYAQKAKQDKENSNNENSNEDGNGNGNDSDGNDNIDDNNKNDYNGSKENDSNDGNDKQENSEYGGINGTTPGNFVDEANDSPEMNGVTKGNENSNDNNNSDNDRYNTNVNNDNMDTHSNNNGNSNEILDSDEDQAGARRSVTFPDEKSSDENNNNPPPGYGSRNRTMSMNRYAMNALREEYARLEATVQGYKDTIESNREEIEDLKERLAEAERSKCRLVTSVSEELNNYRQIIKQLADKRIVVKLQSNGYVVNGKKY